jgi:hypothetical protein
MKRALRTLKQTPPATIPMICKCRTIGSVLITAMLLVASVGSFIRSAEGQNLSPAAPAATTLLRAHVANPNPNVRAVAAPDFHGAKMPSPSKTATATSTPLFLQPSTSKVGMNGNYWGTITPVQTVSADFNGDGNADVATGIQGDNAVSVMLGNGKGGFSAPVEYSVGTDNPIGLAVGDFNNDGIADLAVAAGDDVYFLMGNGDGKFQQPVQVASLPAAGWYLTLGDFNNDGNLDLAVATDGPSGNAPDSYVVVLLGKGNGTFQSPTEYSVGNLDLYTVVAGDFNGDGKLDLAAVTSGSDGPSQVQIFLGQGDGTFKAGFTHSTSFYWSYGAAVGDFNGDGKLDLAVANGCGDELCFDTGSVSIFLGEGNGEFEAPKQLGSKLVGVGFWSLAVADYNGDGILDIASQSEPSGGVYVFLGTGDGKFQDAASYVTEESPYSIVAADFNNDKHTDLLTSDLNPYGYTINPPSVAVLLNDGKGTFDSGTLYGVYAEPMSAAIGDLAGTGKMDLITISQYGTQHKPGPQLGVMMGSGTGTFKPVVSYAVTDLFSSAGQIALGDFTGKGRLDIAVAQGDGLGVFLNKGNGTFMPETVYPTLGGYNEGIATGDFNGDGKLDVAVAEGSDAVVFLGNGDGTFKSATFYAVGGDPAFGIGVGDFNGDGKLDLVVANAQCNNPSSCTVSVLLGNGDGTFQTNVDYPAGSYPQAVIVADLNGDGKLDLVVGQQDAPLNVLLGNGDGTFQPATTYEAGYLDTFLTVADINGDGIPDIIDGAGVLLGKGDGTFQPLTTYLFGWPAGGIAAADLNGDGAIDVFTANIQLTSNSVLLNITGARIQLTSTPNPSQIGQSVTFSATVAASVQNVATIPTGTVTFKQGSTTLGTSKLVKGVATLKYSKLSKGKVKVVAQYSGDENFQPSTSNVIVQVVH